MELVRVVVKRRSTDGSSELNINVQTTPAGSLLAGATVLWIGTKVFRILKRRWWLPVGAGVAMLALRQLTSANKHQKVQEQTCEEE
jgi:hypothetical protein